MDVLTDSSVVSLIGTHANGLPARLAVSDGSRALTYAELERQSNRLAAYLKSLGARPDRCIALMLDRSADFVVAALAVMKSGAAYLPLDLATPIERVSFILADADVPILLTRGGNGRQLEGGPWRVIEIDSADFDYISAYPDSAPAESAMPESLAYVVYTSGSTGRPKGVEITHANLLNLIEWHNDAFEVTSADRASQVAGLGFDAAVWEIWPHLAAGASLFIADEITRRSPQALRDWLIAQRITISFAPTILAEQMLNLNWPPETALRTLLTGADTLRRHPPAGLPFRLINNYGPSECTVVTTSGAVPPAPGEAVPEGPPSIGKPITNATVLILDSELKAVQSGEAGELCVAGALVGRGYRGNPQLTAAKFIDHVQPDGTQLRIYRTGDRARFLENGEIAFLGRLDDQVKIRGYRVELGEIIASLDRHLGVEASAVIVRDGDASGPLLVAYVVPAKDARLVAADLRDFLAVRLPDYMIPAHFIAIESLPMTANGKLDKAALPAPSAANLLPMSAGVSNATTSPPQGLEPRIAAIVAALLGQPTVAREDNFFMLGGHSMLGVQLVARIRDAFGVKLTLRQLFSAPTVAALSAEVARLAPGGNA